MTDPIPPGLDEHIASTATPRDLAGLVWRGLGWRCRLRRRHDFHHVGAYMFRCTGCMHEYEFTFGPGVTAPTPDQIVAVINTSSRRRRRSNVPKR